MFARKHKVQMCVNDPWPFVKLTVAHLSHLVPIYCRFTAGLKGTADFVERIAVVAHDLASLRHVAEFLGELKQR